MELLNEDRQNELLAQPESGMGYQIVDIMLRDGSVRRGTAFNGEILLYSEEPLDGLKRVIEPSRRFQMLERKELGLGEEIVELKVVATETQSASRVREGSDVEATSPSTGANEAPEEGSQVDEEFKRFCAFANHRRVTATGGLSPGTYATTAADARQVDTGSDAVKRYALPNPNPAIYRFTITPPVKTALKRGVVQPAYGQPGGGVEVIFVNGSPNNTVIGPIQIPP